jgi:hypothetical protein
MKLSQAYSTVVKYGLAPQEGIDEWHRTADEYQKINKSTNTEEDYSHPDHYLADWLEDQGDPRHLIVRKDLEIRRFPGRAFYAEKLPVRLKELIGTTSTDNGGVKRISNELSILKYTGDKGVAYRLRWEQPRIDFTGLFTPEEAEDFLRQYGSDKTLKDFD